MEGAQKKWLIGGVVVMAILVGFAIFKVASTKSTTVTSGGGSTSTKTNGLDQLLGPILTWL